VLLLDEVDALVGDTLISLLRQLRAGYPQRPGLSTDHHPVRRARSARLPHPCSSEREPITGGSAFNIKAQVAAAGRLQRR
jgi:hypothetical protein